LELSPLTLAIFLAPPLTPLIFGTEWKEMGVIVAHMAPWMFMALVVSSMSRALSVLQKQKWKFIYDTPALGIVFLVYFLAKKNQCGLVEF
jgi:O-antigen/teichoic acid export membrane protein